MEGRVKTSKKYKRSQCSQLTTQSPLLLLQRRRIRVLHALVHTHELLARTLRNLDKLPQIPNSRLVQVVHDDKVTALVDITLERIQLLLGCAGGRPQPILNIDAPVDNVRAVISGGRSEALAHTCALSAERRAEVRVLGAGQCLVDGSNVLVVLPVDGGVVGQALHLGMRVRVQRDLVTSRGHLVVDVGEVGGGVEQRRTDGEEGDLDVLLLDDLEDFLRILGGAIVDGEGEAVGPLAGEDEVAGGQLVGDLEAGRNRVDDFDLAERDRIGLVETLESEADNTALVDIEVAHGDVNVRGRGIAGGLNRVPGLRVGRDGLVACGIVLLQSNGEGVGAAVGDVQVALIVAAHVTAGTGDLGVEGVIGVVRLDGQLVGPPSQGHAIITTVPVAESVGVLVGELIDNKCGSSASRGRDGRAGTSRGRRDSGDVFTRSVSAVKTHRSKCDGLSELREKNSGDLRGVKAAELGERNAIELLGAVESPAKILARDSDLLGRFTTASGNRVEFNRQSGSGGSLELHGDTTVGVLGVGATRLTVEVAAGVLGSIGDSVSAGVDNDGLHGTIIRAWLQHGVVVKESQARLRNPVIDDKVLALARGSRCITRDQSGAGGNGVSGFSGRGST